MAGSGLLRPRIGNAADLAVLVAVAVVGLLLAIAFSGARERELERSAMGSRGLVEVLRAAGLEARYAGFETIRAGDDVFRVLPVLDTDLSAPFVRPEADEDYLRTGTERDLTAYVLTAKVATLPTLVIAPKWTRAARLSGYAHESLLLPPEEAAQGLAPLGLHEGGLLRPAERVFRFRSGGRTGLLYAPQLFPAPLAEGCESEISLNQGALLIRCDRPGAPPMWALSDPDLLNAHGLALAENAQIAVTLLRGLAGAAPILVDTTDEIFVLPQERALPQRSWADLGRFFAYPFSLAWGGFAVLAALVLWRGGLRFGPARRLFDDRLSASRAVSIAAKARLLRQAGNDRALMERHLANRLRRIERALFGQVHPGPPEQRILAYLERSDPRLGQGFAAALEEVRTSGGERALEALADFERQAGRVIHGS